MHLNLAATSACAVARPLFLLAMMAPTIAWSGDDEKLVREAFDAHNKARASARLGSLSLDERLAAAARVHARDMAGHKLMSHEGSDGSRPADRVKRQGYRYRTMGENVARGQPTVEEVMDVWMNSPVHKKNILGAFTQVGIAVERGDDGRPYWCVEFGTPLTSLDPAAAGTGVESGLNRERSAAGLAPLRSDPRLARIARRLAEALAHTSPADNPTVSEELLTRSLREEGSRPKEITVLAAYGQPSPADLVAHILANPEERRQSLGNYTQVGVGYVANEGGTPFWCVVLANPLRK